MVIELSKDETVIDIATGAAHILALTSKKRVFSCGHYKQYQLGRHIKNGSNMDDWINFKPIRQLKNISCGYFNSFVIDESEDVYTWGLNNHGQTGISINPSSKRDSKLYVKKPTKVHLMGVKEIAAAKDHTIWLFYGGDIFLYTENTGTDELPTITKISTNNDIDFAQAVDGDIFYRLKNSVKWKKMTNESTTLVYTFKSWYNFRSEIIYRL